MKNFAKLGLTAVLVAFIFSFSANAQGNFVPEILKRMDNHNKALTSLKANVKMSKFNTQLNLEDINEGTVAYRPNGKDIAIRIDWTKPRTETLSVINGTYTLYTPSAKQAIVGKADGSAKKGVPKDGLAFMNMSKSQLKANYEVKYSGKETAGGVECWHLIMSPKVKANYKQAELWVDADGMPRQSRILENSSDITTVLLSNIVTNEKIDGSIFAIALPKGTKIIKG